MDWQIAAWLTQDGLTNGAIYCLLGLAIVLVFAVTRVIFVPQGEFVTFGALTLAALQADNRPGSVWLVAVIAILVALANVVAALRGTDRAGLGRRLASEAALPLAIAVVVAALARVKLPLLVDVLLTLALITPLGPTLYRLVYQPLVGASVLVLLIASVALHFALTGLALVFFGAEGFKTPAFSDASLQVGSLTVNGQTLWIFGITGLLIVAMAWVFGRTLYGKALRATAFNRVGARLIGFSPVTAGRITFTAAAFIGTLSGVLIGPIVTVYYDSGFIIGLKGFVAAIIGGLGSYPLTAVGAVLVGLLESFSSFWASGYKEVIVFTLIIPVLIVLSVTTVHHEQEEE
ncbi:MAG: branched-chain amino acid ABC transporter permease [Burkholderiaceae bacterium]